MCEKITIITKRIEEKHKQKKSDTSKCWQSIMIKEKVKEGEREREKRNCSK